MIDQHQQLINQYKEIEELCKKSKNKTIILEILVVAIVCGMKSIQATASLTLNMVACTCVCGLLLWHFWDFNCKRSLDRKSADIVTEGVGIERKNPFSGLCFFQNYLKEFSVLGEISRIAIFDFVFLYFFSVSITQLLNCTNPEIVAKLMHSTSVRTFVISAVLGWAYYMPLRPIAHLKKELKGS